VLEAGDKVKDLLGAEGEGFGLVFWRGRGKCWSFDSHPSDKDLSPGTPVLLCLLRMTALWRKEAGGAGLGFGAEVVEFDVA
jgi:hypothetical protein